MEWGGVPGQDAPLTRTSPLSEHFMALMMFLGEDVFVSLMNKSFPFLSNLPCCCAQQRRSQERAEPESQAPRGRARAPRPGAVVWMEGTQPACSDPCRPDARRSHPPSLLKAALGSQVLSGFFRAQLPAARPGGAAQPRSRSASGSWKTRRSRVCDEEDGQRLLFTSRVPGTILSGFM